MAFLARDSTKVVAMEIECEFRLKPAMDSERMAIDCISAPSRPCLPMPQSARSTERRKLFCFAIGFFLSFMIRSLIQSNQGRESSVDDSAAEIAETPADRHFKPGESGNPTGRPRRAKNKTTLLAEEAMAEKARSPTSWSSVRWPAARPRFAKSSIARCRCRAVASASTCPICVDRAGSPMPRRR